MAHKTPLRYAVMIVVDLTIAKARINPGSPALPSNPEYPTFTKTNDMRTHRPYPPEWWNATWLSALLFLAPLLGQAQIAAWDFTGENAVATSSAEVYNANMDASNLITRGSGAAASSGNNSFRTQGFQNNGIATSNTDYFEVTLSASTGFALSLSTIDARFAGTNTFYASPGVSHQFAYSTDGSTFNLIGSPGTMTATGAMPQVDLSGVGALQNVAAGTTITLRYYASGQTSTGGWGFNSSNSGLYGLAIGGTLTASGGCGIAIGSVNTSCNTNTPGTDTYDLSIAYTGMDAGTAVVNNTPSGTIAGNNPASVANGTIIISGINEGDAYNVTFTAPCASLTVSGTSPSCIPACGITLGSATATCNSITAGPGDTYDLSIPYTGAQAGVVVTNNSGSGTVAGDDPAVLANGTIIISGISEADAYAVAFSAPCGALAVNGAAPDCEPAPSLTIINFDVAGNWTQGAVILGSYATDHVYAASDWSFTGGPALRSGTTAQDGFPSALGTYSWRLQNLATTDWRATYTGTATVTQFGFSVRRWDGSPDPSYNVTYSTDGGTTFSSAVLTINNAFLGATSNWSNFSYTIPAPVQLAPGNLIVRVAANSANERIMIDDFSFDTGAIACALVLGTATTSCDAFTEGTDTYTLSIPYTGMQAGATVVNNSGSGTVGGNDPSIVTNGTIIISGITEGSGYSVTFNSPCETLVVSGLSEVCLPPPSLVINEVDYDQPSVDGTEFIELKNTGATAVELNGLKLILVNGTTESPYNTITLPAFSLAAGDYYVVGSSSVANVDLISFTADGIQNGAPDGIQLLTATNDVIDQISYEGNMSSTEGTGAPGDPNQGVGASIARLPDGTDTGDNSVDFTLTCSTPGTANTFVDSDTDGTPDCLDVCAGGPEPGTACNDGNEQTANDVIQSNCLCAGVLIDCLGTPGGSALPGTECDDGNPGTVDDVYQPNCTCAGVPLDCLGVPGGPNMPGAPCNDFDPSTNDETWQANCTCVGTPCSQHVLLDLRSDVNSDQMSWEILYQNDGTVVCSGGSYQHGVEDPIVESCCLPIGCFRLRVYDSGGDGFVTGGYQLRESGINGQRIIDNTGNFTNGSTSAIGTAYDNGAFCVPIGTDKPIFSSCDKLDWVNNKFIVAVANSAVSAQYGVSNANSGYEFWFFDPNGGYNFRRFRSHATSDGFGSGALRACHFKVNGWVNSGATPHIPANTLLNVRIRGRVAGTNLAFGPACLFKIDAALAACPRVKLQDNPANTSDFSCGVTRTFGGSPNAGNRIYANPPQPVPAVASSQVRYQFRFRLPGEGICIVRPPQTSAQLTLNWTTGTLLECSKTYDVDVRVSLNAGASWCFGPATADQATACADTQDWGKVCTVSIGGCDEFNEGGNTMAPRGADAFTLYPNPNQGRQLFLHLNHVQNGVANVAVEILDMTGKRVMTRTIATQDGTVSTNLLLDEPLVGGLYLVHVTAGAKTYTERLVIQP